MLQIFLRAQPEEVKVTTISSASAGPVDGALGVEIAKGDGTAVAAMLAWHSAQDDMGMLEAGPDRAEVIEPTVARCAGEDWRRTRS